MELKTRTTKGRPAERTPRKGEIPPTYPKGRVCTTPGCKTILNQYHEGTQCYACDPSPRYRILGSAEELEELMVAA